MADKMLQPMRIAVFHDLPAGGAKRALYDVCRVLAQQGHHLDLFIPETADETFLPLVRFVKKTQIFPTKATRENSVKGPAIRTRWTGFFTKACQKQIADTINRAHYDIALVHPGRYPNVPFLLRYLTIPSLLYLMEKNRVLSEVPIVDLMSSCSNKNTLSKVWQSSFMNQILVNIKHHKWAERKNILFATTVLSISNFAREGILMSTGVNAHVNYLGVDTDEFRPLKLPREPIVLTVGRVQHLKGFRFLIASVAKIDVAIRPAVVILGHGSLPEEQQLLTEMALENHVDLQIHRVEDDELVRWYNRASIVTFLPYLEPFGYIPLEAMACGTPVIGIREGGVRETVIDGETGILVDRDPQSCADAIIKLLADEALRKRMGAEGRLQVERNWTCEQSGRRLTEHLRATISAYAERTRN